MTLALWLAFTLALAVPAIVEIERDLAIPTVKVSGLPPLAFKPGDEVLATTATSLQERTTVVLVRGGDVWCSRSRIRSMTAKVWGRLCVVDPG